MVVLQHLQFIEDQSLQSLHGKILPILGLGAFKKNLSFCSPELSQQLEPWMVSQNSSPLKSLNTPSPISSTPFLKVKQTLTILTQMLNNSTRFSGRMLIVGVRG